MNRLAFLFLWNRFLLKLGFALFPTLAARKAIQIFCTPFIKKVREPELEVLARAQTSFHTFGNQSLQVYTWGTSTRTALLVHGWEGNAGNLGAFVDSLVKEGYSVVAFDGPAHGNSDGSQTNLIQFSSVIASLLQIYTHTDLIIAHSFGSAASVLALHDYPQLSVNRLVLLTTPDRLLDVLTQFTQVMKFTAKQRLLFIEQLERKFNRKISEMQTSQLCQGANVQQVLLVHDEGDKVIPFQSSARVAENWPGSSLIKTQKIGHYRMLWNPEVMGHVREFLAREAVNKA